MPDCIERAVHDHHVVYEAELKRRWSAGTVDKTYFPSLTRLLRDKRNLAPSCQPHHFGHHGLHKLKVIWLHDWTIEFAFQVLGPYAYDYLRRYYDDTDADPRLERGLARTTSPA